jgi:TolB protein
MTFDKQKVSSISLVVLLTLSAVAVIESNNAPSASATYPGTNGKIAFQGENPNPPSFDIFVMNPDGTGITNLSNNPAFEAEPAWSQDGSKIAFVSSRDYLSSNTEIYVMNADGSNQTRLTHLGNAHNPRLSPDGSKIVFQGPDGIDVMNADGKDLRNLVKENFAQMAPDWSPDGKKIAFVSLPNPPSENSDIYVMNADGSNQTRLTHTGTASEPNWSPDGTKIVFSGSSTTQNVSRSTISVINADGTGLREINTSKDILGKSKPVWSPDGTKIAFEGGEFTDRSGNGIYVTNADGSNTVLIAHSPATNPDWGVKSSTIFPPPPPPLQPKTHTLTINSVDLLGKPVSGVWTELLTPDGSIVIKSGFTPLTMPDLAEGDRFKVKMSNYDGEVFQHWQDNNSTDGSRIVNLSADTNLTAVYDTGDSLRGFTLLTYTGTKEQPDLTVNALTTDGNKTLHMWTIIDPESTNASGTTYKVYATNGYQNLIFDHWSDNGSTDRVRTLTIDKATTITAYYKMS